MNRNRLLRMMLSLVLTMTMVFSPLMSCYVSLAAAGDGTDQTVTEDQDISGETSDAEVSDDESAAPATSDDAEAEGIAEEADIDSDESAVQDDSDETEIIDAQDAESQETEDQDSDAVTDQETGETDEETVDEEEEETSSTETEYVYEDKTVKVTATLSDASAVPDDAELVVTQIDGESESYDYDAYMDALNQDSDIVYDENNTLLYDIAFIKDGAELQPETGTVTVDFEFLDSQLTDALGAEKKSDISVIHLPLRDEIREQFNTTADAKQLDADDIDVEEVTEEDNDLKVSVKKEKVSFALDSFSGVAIANGLLGDTASGDATNDYNFKSILGPGLYYGITAETFDQKSHIQTNFAVNLYKGNGQGVDPDLSSASGAIVMSDAEYNGNGYIDMGTKNSGTVLLYTNKSGKVLNNPRDFVKIITEDTATIRANYVDPIISYGASMSGELLSHADTPDVKITSDASKMVIDTTDFLTDATIYIDGDNITSYLQDGKLRIYKHPDQVIVFNFNSTDTLKLGRFWVGYPDMSKYTGVAEELDGKSYIKSDTPVTKGDKNNAIDTIAAHIAWNCNSVTSLELSETTGMFLVPKTTATAEVTSTSSGWLITGGKFTNTGGEWHSVYNELPDVDKANLSMKKTVDGKTPSMNQKFEFTIDKLDKSVSGNWKNLVTVQNDGGAINYSDNNLDQGWNVYKITETKKADSTAGNYVLDSTVYYAAVKYENKASAGQDPVWVASLARYYKAFDASKFVADGDTPESIGMSDPVKELPATFKNFTASSQAELKVKKILDGKAQWGDSDEFTFILTRGTNTAGDGIETPMPEGVTEDTTTVTIKSSDASKTKSFGTITYNAAGEYNYTIQEVVPDDAVNADNIKYSDATESQKQAGGFVKDNITYDGSIHNVVVVVGEDPDDSSGLVIKSIKCDGKTTDTQEITNTYESQAGEGEIIVKKVLKGREWKTGDTFTFTIVGKSAPEGINDVPMPEITTVTITSADAPDYIKSFGKITYTKAGVYTYEITESRKDPIAGITYDKSVHIVKVTVKGGNNGLLTMDTLDGETVTETFTNTYEATGEGEIKVQKVLNGREWTDDDTFTFTIEGKSAPEGVDPVPMPETRSITIRNSDADQTRSFGKIPFTKEGTYTYTVKETKGSLGGVTYDETEHTVTIKVVDDRQGHLIADTGSALIKVEQITNTYAASGSIRLKATKEFTGRDWTDDDSFEFTLAADESNPEGAKLPATVNKTATKNTPTVEFDAITFTKAGTYTFTITETVPEGADKDGKLNGITYDGTAKTITVIVTDKGDGTLECKASPQDAKVTASNTYEATGGAELEATKSINDWGKAERFIFTLNVN